MAKAVSLNFSTKNKKVVDSKPSPEHVIPKRGTRSIKSERTEVKTKKINLTLNTKSLNKNRQKKQQKVFSVLLVLILIVIAAIGYLAYYYLFIPVRNINHSVNNIQNESVELLTELNNKDLSKIDSHSNNIQAEIDNIDGQINRYEFLKNYKSTKGYYDNLQISKSILAKTDALLQKTLPDLKNALATSGFSVEEGQVMETEGEGETSAFSLVMQELPQYLALYEEIEPDIMDIFFEVKKLDPEYVPDVGDYELKDKLQKGNEFIEEYPNLSFKTKNLLKYIPTLIGANDSAEYLLILQNETEMRASGGLLTAYGHTSFVNGEFGEEISLQDAWPLQEYLWALKLPMPQYNIHGQLFLMNRNCGASEARVQDSAMYPDLYETMTTFSEYYDRATYYNPDKYPAYEHTLLINHAFAENLISLIEPLEVPGSGTVTRENLFDFIKTETDDANRQYDDDRKAIIKDIANAAKEKFFEIPLTDMPKVVELLVRSFQAKDIAVASKNPDIQNYLDEYGLTGRIIQDFDGDYFHLNEAQNCSLKLNKFIRNTVQMDLDIDDGGALYKNVKIKWQQTQVYNDSLNKQYDPTLQFRYRAWVRIFAPVGSGNFNSDGYQKAAPFYYYPKSYYDSVVDKQVSDNVIAFDHRRFNESDAVERQELNIGYNLPNSLNYNDNGIYKLLIQKHPGKSWGEKYTLNINHKGKTYTTEFTLDRDKVVTYSDGIISIDNYDKNLDWIVNLTQKIPFDKLKSEE